MKHTTKLILLPALLFALLTTGCPQSGKHSGKKNQGANPALPQNPYELTESDVLTAFGLRRGNITASAAAKKIATDTPASGITFTERNFIAYDDQTGMFTVKIKGLKNGKTFDKTLTLAGFTHPLDGKLIQSVDSCELNLDEGIEHNYSLAKYIEGKVAIPFPTFNEYPERFTRAEVVPVPTDAKNFSYSADVILKTVKDKNAKTVLLINPDNPTGNFLQKDEVFRLCAELKKENVVLIFDESFIDFADKEIRYTLLDEEILNAYPNLIVIKSISKSYGVPGLRLGVLASSDATYIAHIRKTNAIWNINSFGEYFLQIYDKYNKTYATACDSIAEERSRFTKKLAEIKSVFVFPSQANYVLCRLDARKAEALTVSLLEKYNIFIKDLSAKKGFESGDYVRLAVRNQKDNDALIAALKDILKA